MYLYIIDNKVSIICILFLILQYAYMFGIVFKPWRDAIRQMSITFHIIPYLTFSKKLYKEFTCSTTKCWSIIAFNYVLIEIIAGFRLYLLLIRFQPLHENRHDMQIVNVRVQRSLFSIFTKSVSTRSAE